MTLDEFRRVGHQLINWIADYRSNVANSKDKAISTLPVRNNRLRLEHSLSKATPSPKRDA